MNNWHVWYAIRRRGSSQCGSWSSRLCLSKSENGLSPQGRQKREFWEWEGKLKMFPIPVEGEMSGADMVSSYASSGGNGGERQERADPARPDPIAHWEGSPYGNRSAGRTENRHHWDNNTQDNVRQVSTHEGLRYISGTRGHWRLT
jgi:hypothetical protein